MRKKRAWLRACNARFTSNNVRVVHKDVHGYVSCTTEHAYRAQKRAWLCACNARFTSKNVRVVHKDVHGYVLGMAQASTNNVHVVRRDVHGYVSCTTEHACRAQKTCMAMCLQWLKLQPIKCVWCAISVHGYVLAMQGSHPRTCVWCAKTCMDM